MKLPITVFVATKNEELNIARCLQALAPTERIVVLDSGSTDHTAEIAARAGAEVVQFEYKGGYPKKRQWALDTIEVNTPWVMLVDADEVVPKELWAEIGRVVKSPNGKTAYMITKGFHFLGRRFRFGGFSFEAVLLFRRGTAKFEELAVAPGAGHDMEVHERLVVSGTVGRLRTPLIHEDFKGLQAYIDRHNRYSTWEAQLRFRFLRGGRYGEETIEPRLFGNSQERRRFLKYIAVRLPLEPSIWFAYHFIARLGILEGRRGLIASQIRASYIQQVRAKMYELSLDKQPSRRTEHHENLAAEATDRRMPADHGPINA